MVMIKCRERPGEHKGLLQKGARALTFAMSYLAGAGL